jgi:hypothetical protein
MPYVGYGGVANQANTTDGFALGVGARNDPTETGFGENVGDGGVVILDGRDGDACGAPLPTLTKLTCGACCPGFVGVFGACCPGFICAGFIGDGFVGGCGCAADVPPADSFPPGRKSLSNLGDFPVKMKSDSLFLLPGFALKDPTAAEIFLGSPLFAAETTDGGT